MRRGGGAWQQSKYIVLCMLYRRRLKGDTAMAPVLVKKIWDRLAPFKWRLNAGDKRACAAVTDAMAVQPSGRCEQVSTKTCFWQRFSREPETNGGGAKVRKSQSDTRTKREISYTLLMSAPAPKLLFLITFPCDIICCEIVYAWGTFSSCQLKSIWTNQYLSILWHTHSWPLGKSCLK